MSRSSVELMRRMAVLRVEMRSRSDWFSRLASWETVRAPAFADRDESQCAAASRVMRRDYRQKFIEKDKRGLHKYTNIAKSRVPWSPLLGVCLEVSIREYGQ